MRMLVVMLVLLLFPALAFVSESFFFTPPDDGLPSLNRESYRVHAIEVGSRSRLSRVVVPAGEKTHSESAFHMSMG